MVVRHLADVNHVSSVSNVTIYFIAMLVTLAITAWCPLRDRVPVVKNTWTIVVQECLIAVNVMFVLIVRGRGIVCGA